MKAIKLHLGLDVHKDSITIAIAQAGRQGELRLFGTITNDLHALEKALARIRKAHPGAHLEVAYEAGPCGFGIARRLQQLKVPCLVAAPSLIPKRPGAPFKTDKRDARAIARLLRAGELTAVYVVSDGGAVRLRQIRLERGFTIEEVARKAHLTNSSVSRHELGETEPKSGALARYCRALNVTPNELLGWKPGDEGPF